jgi:hypothetical protein
MDVRRYAARLEALPHPLRVAVGAACVERILPIFEAMTDDDPRCLALRRAVDLAWSYAECGRVGADELGAVRDSVLDTGLDAAKRATRDEEGDGEDWFERGRLGTVEFVHSAVSSAVEVLLMALDEGDSMRADRIADAAKYAREAVFLFEKYDDKTTNWALAEDQWQEDLLGRAGQTREPAAVRAWRGTCVWRECLDQDW